MGSWDVTVFGNDQAKSWLKDLLAGDSPEPIFRALVGTAKVGATKFLAAPDCECALAAAEMVAAAKGSPSPQVPPEALSWLSTHKFVVGNEIAELAIRVVERVTTDSELKQVWDDTDCAAEWYNETKSIQARLEETRAQFDEINIDSASDGDPYEDAARLVRNGQYEHALSIYDQIVQTEPKSPNAYLGRAICHLWLHQYEKVVEDINKSLSLQSLSRGKPLLDAYQLRSQAAFHLGKYRNAIADLTSFLRSRPQDWDSYFIRGMSYLRLEQFDNAVLDFDVTISNMVGERQREAYENRALCYERLGRHDLAAADRNRVLQLQSLNR